MRDSAPAASLDYLQITLEVHAGGAWFHAVFRPHTNEGVIALKKDIGSEIHRL